MKQRFIASICRGGILGGWITADDEAITYQTGKVTVSPGLKHLELKYRDIQGFSLKRVFCFPVFSIVMKDGETYRFIVFRPGRFGSLLREKVKQ